MKDKVGDVLAWSCFLFVCSHDPVSFPDPFDPSRRIVLNSSDPFDVQGKEAELWQKYKVPPTVLALKGPSGFSALGKNQKIFADIGRLGLRGEDKAIAKQSALGLIDSIENSGLRTTDQFIGAFPDNRVHDLSANYKGWTSIDLVANNPYALGGSRLLFKRTDDGWEFMIRNTH